MKKAESIYALAFMGLFFASVLMISFGSAQDRIVIQYDSYSDKISIQEYEKASTGLITGSDGVEFDSSALYQNGSLKQRESFTKYRSESYTSYTGYGYY